MTARSIFQPRSLTGLIEGNFTNVDIISHDQEGKEHYRVDGEYLHTDIIKEKPEATNKFFQYATHHLKRMKDCIYVDPDTNSYIDDNLEPSMGNVMTYDRSIIHPVSGHIGSWINSNKLILEDFETKSILIKDSQPNKSSVNLTLYNRNQDNTGLYNYTNTGTTIYFNNYTINNNILGHTVASIEAETKLIADYNIYYADLVFKIGTSERMRMTENSTLINYINMNNTDIMNASAIYPTNLYVNGIYEKTLNSNIKFNNTLDVNYNKIINLALPTNGGDAVNKYFFDMQTIKGALTKKNVDIATTTNILLTGEQLIDGITTNLSRVLVKDQINQRANGIYNTNTGTWTRSEDLDNAPSAEIFNGVWTYIILGTINTGFSYRITSQGTGLNELHQIGIDNITWGLSNINFQVTAPIIKTNDMISIAHNTTNLKITTNQLNTIQDITTTSNVIFNQTTTNNIYTDNLYEKTLNNNIVFHNNLDITGFNIVGLNSSTIDDIYVNNIYEKTLNHRIVLKDPVKVGHIHELTPLEGVNIHNALNMNNQAIINITNCKTDILYTDTINAKNLTIGSIITVNNDLNMLGNDITGINVLKTTDLYVEHIYPKDIATLLINIYQDLNLQTHDLKAVKNIKLQSIEHVTPGAIIEFLSKIKLSASIAGTPTRYLGLSASNEVITTTPNSLIADLDFYNTYKIINLLKLSMNIIDPLDFVILIRTNVMDFKASVPNTVGIGFNHGKTQYISPSGFEFYMGGMKAFEISNIAVNIQDNRKLSFGGSSGTAGTINKIEFASDIGFGMSGMGVDYVTGTNGYHSFYISTARRFMMSNTEFISTAAHLVAGSGGHLIVQGGGSLLIRNDSNVDTANISPLGIVTCNSTYTDYIAPKTGLYDITLTYYGIEQHRCGGNASAITMSHQAYHGRMSINRWNGGSSNDVTATILFEGNSGTITTTNLNCTTMNSTTMNCTTMNCTNARIAENNKLYLGSSSLFNIGVVGGGNLDYKSGIRHRFHGNSGAILANFEDSSVYFSQPVACQSTLDVTSTTNLYSHVYLPNSTSFNFYDGYINGRFAYLNTIFGYLGGAVSINPTLFYDGAILDNAPLQYVTRQGTNRIVVSGFSDSRLKKNIIEPSINELWDLVKDIKIYKYNMKTNEEFRQDKQNILDSLNIPAKLYEMTLNDGGKDTDGIKTHYGVVLDENSNIFAQQGDYDDGYTVDYLKMTPILLAKVKSQETIINSLIERLNILEIIYRDLP